MNTTAFIALLMSGWPICADEQGMAMIEYGTTVLIPDKNAGKEPRPKTALDREIEAFLAHHEARSCSLIKVTDGSAPDDSEGREVGSESMGAVRNPDEIIILAQPMAAPAMANFYNSIQRLPDCAACVVIWYTESKDYSKCGLLGYTIKNYEGNYTKLVKYDGKTPWFQWIMSSFKNDDAEQSRAGQPAAAPESKPESGEVPQPQPQQQLQPQPRLKPDSESRPC